MGEHMWISIITALLRAALVLLAATLSLPSYALTRAEARHLLDRTGFTATANEIEAFETLDRKEAVTQLLATANEKPLTPLPGWADDPLPDLRRLRNRSEQEKKAARKRNRQRQWGLKGWWYREMLTTDSPLTERMTLFWHNHFTSSLRKVRSPRLMLRQNLLLRRHALGSFADLLHAIARDPAMLVYLDGRTNRKGQPNENFARELLELFTLGEGHYSEQDIKAAARAFTGYGLERGSGAFRFRSRRHDDGPKTFLGLRGNWEGDDIIDILLAQQQTARFISRQLWDEFITLPPAAGKIEALAREFRDGGYLVGPLLKQILGSEAFWDPRNRGSRIKSPVELLVGSLRVFGVPLEDGRRLARAGRRLGQDLFDPPNVKGWPGGEAWIDSATLLARRQVIERFTHGRTMGATRRQGLLKGRRDTSGERERLRKLLLPRPPLQEPQADSLTGYVAQLLLDPAYQLN